MSTQRADERDHRSVWFLVAIFASMVAMVVYRHEFAALVDGDTAPDCRARCAAVGLVPVTDTDTDTCATDCACEGAC